MPSTKKSISKRAASIVSSAYPPPPHLLHYLHLQLIVATFKATQVESSQRQAKSRQLGSQSGRQTSRPFCMLLLPPRTLPFPLPPWHLHACINLNILCCVDARMPYELSARYRSVCFKLNCKYLNVAGPDIEYTPSVLSQTVN